MFSAELFNDTLPSSLKERFGECAVIYAVISEEGVLKASSLSDTGILSIPVTAMFGSTKVNNVVSIDLKEGKPSDAYMLKMKVNRLEAIIEEMKQVQLSLKAENAQLKESVTALTAETERQRELERRELRKIESQVDTNGPFSNLVRLEGRKFTVPAREGDRYPWFPIYLSREPIRGNRYFEVQMDAVGNNLVMIGIDSIENRERGNNHSNQGSMLMCAYGYEGFYINGVNRRDVSYTCVNGDHIRVTVNLFESTVIWERVHPSYKLIAKISIPEGIRQRDFYPSIEFVRDYNGSLVLL